MANQSIKNAFERMWAHTTSKLEEKANKEDINEIIKNVDENTSTIAKFQATTSEDIEGIFNK